MLQTKKPPAQTGREPSLTGLVVRLAGENDVHALSYIAASTFALACPPTTRKIDLDSYIKAELSANSFREHLASPAKILFAADFHGRVVGYQMLTGERKVANPALLLNQLYVGQEHHGQGVAQVLLNRAIEYCGALGFDGIRLGVSKANARAIAFYRKNEFVIDSERKVTIGSDTHEDWVMIRKLVLQDEH